MPSNDEIRRKLEQIRDELAFIVGAIADPPEQPSPDPMLDCRPSTAPRTSELEKFQQFVEDHYKDAPSPGEKLGAEMAEKLFHRMSRDYVAIGPHLISLRKDEMTDEHKQLLDAIEAAVADEQARKERERAEQEAARQRAIEAEARAKAELARIAAEQASAAERRKLLAAAAENRERVYREALEFYADGHSYVEDVPDPSMRDGEIPVLEDDGERARSALASALPEGGK